MRGLTRYLVLLQAVWWFGYFAPGHQRGVVTIGESGGSASCCVVDATGGNSFAGCQLPGEGDKGQKAPTDPSKRCAVCYLGAHMDAPVAIDLTLPPLGLAAFLAETGSERVCASEVGGWFLSRAPPVV